MKVEKDKQILVEMTKDEAQEVWTSLEEIKELKNGQINALLNELCIKLKS